MASSAGVVRTFSVVSARCSPSDSVTRWPLEGTLMRCGTANSVAKLPSNTLTSKLGSASGALAAAATGTGAGAAARRWRASPAAGGGSMPTRQGRGSGPWVSAPG